MIRRAEIDIHEHQEEPFAVSAMLIMCMAHRNSNLHSPSNCYRLLMLSIADATDFRRC